MTTCPTSTTRETTLATTVLALAVAFVSIGGALGWAVEVRADSIERAKRIHDRLVGIPPDADRLAEIEQRLEDDGPVEAALYALEHPVFYSSTLKNFVTPWTNVDQTVFAALNDYSALVIGMVRDDVPFNTVLSADLAYVGRAGLVADGYSPNNNNHYEQLEADRVDLSNPLDFVDVPQSSLPGSQLASSDAAGVTTTRAAGEAFFSAGTNRRMLRFTAMNFLCRDMEDLHDTAIPADWIRQDVSRSPVVTARSSATRAWAATRAWIRWRAAFAFFEWQTGDDDDANRNGRVTHTPGLVQPKHLINGNTFPFGYVTTDNRWENRWVTGKNSVLGWPSFPESGYGPKSMGQAVANSEAFATCQVEKVFEQVCFRPTSARRIATPSRRSRSLSGRAMSTA